MSKMSIRIILKSGVDFIIKCDVFTLTEDNAGAVCGFNCKGITENAPVYLDLDQIAAVVRIQSDEND